MAMKISSKDMDEGQRLGRWTRLFGRPTLFSEDVKKAKEVASTVQLFGIGDLKDNQFVKIIFDSLEGWDRPLWASDGEWLYLRRPQGVWKTRLPKEHLDRIGVIGQTRAGSRKVYGGLQIGRDFSNSPRWHARMQETEPEAMDDFHGLPKDGYEAGPLIEKWIENVGPRVILDAGDVFAEPPIYCRHAGKEIFAEDSAGRKVRFLVAGADMGKLAREGNLWLRFGHGPTSWMDAFDCQVTARA